jgi:Cof subfamily protein (haloacid dehalogenase superfamily)
LYFVFDLDGTICFKGQPVSEHILAALDELQRNGHKVIFASARPIRDMLPVLHKRFHTFPLIGGNGSLISTNGKLTFIKSFSDEQFKNILSIIDEYDATYLIDSDWDYSYTGPKDHPILKNVDPFQLANCVPVTSLKSIVKVLILTANNMEQVAHKLSNLEVVIHKHTNENVIDISPKHIHKWSALQTLGVKEREYLAFGNDANELSPYNCVKSMFQK